MIKIFRSYHPLSYLLVLFYAVLVNANLFISPAEVSVDKWGFLSNLIPVISGYEYYGAAIIILLVGVAASIYLNNLMNEHKLFGRSSAFIAAAFVLAMGYANTFFVQEPAFCIVLPLVFALSQMLISYKNKSALPLFNAGFGLGLASLLYPPASLLVLSFFVFNITTRTFSLREWGITLLALCCPIYVGGGMSYLMDLLGTFYSHLIGVEFWGVYMIMWEWWPYFIAGGLYFLIFLWALFRLQTYFARTSIRNRKYYSLLIWWYVVVAACFLFLGYDFRADLIMALIPVSVFLAFIWYESKRVFITEFIHVILLLILFSFQYLLN